MFTDHYFGFPPLLKKGNKVLQRWRVIAFYRIASCLRQSEHTEEVCLNFAFVIQICRHGFLSL